MTDHLFEIPAAQPAAPREPGDLYVPDKLRSSRASPAENARVRALLHHHCTAEARATVGPTASAGSYTRAVAAARGGVARHSLELGARLHLRLWGNPRTRHHAKADPRLDAAYTNLRQFWAGRDLAPWALCLVEAAICDLRGMALPGCAYAEERTLDEQPPQLPVQRQRPTPRQRQEGMW